MRVREKHAVDKQRLVRSSPADVRSGRSSRIGGVGGRGCLFGFDFSGHVRFVKNDVVVGIQRATVAIGVGVGVSTRVADQSRSKGKEVKRGGWSVLSTADKLTKKHACSNGAKGYAVLEGCWIAPVRVRVRVRPRRVVGAAYCCGAPLRMRA